MLVHIKEVISWAQKKKCAVGAFNTSNLETTLGIVNGAIKAKKPIIIQVSETAIKYAGLKPITHIVETVAKNEAVNVPVALHLDHGKSFHSVAECIHAGFSSIMIDASDVPFDENVVLTKQAVDYAHKYDVWAQGELGQVKGWEDNVFSEKGFLTDPKEAQEFVEKTGINTLAVAIGNVHGVEKIRKGLPRLDIKRLKEINAKIKVPLVLHGASGLGRDQIFQAVANGIRIINIDTEIRLIFTTTLRRVLSQHKEEIDIRNLMPQPMEAVQRLVERKVKMFALEA
ncbi:class II fructose-bisphosphate aldolase [Patescibacteria group bacterium]|nr:class II fructose-bisphosphate aldolase [Patescibacteria group bacterium]MBU4512621.1 class II fructose-bisphosphate aldolase [Patescibacteria group bacterium]MCG2693527.1 class II fructose-bisphosphate aldolase [Candidatus Parcubacteria bacterium]